MLKFSKMHGLGNDFSLFNGFDNQLPDYGALARAICDRHFGVGGDGIMIALPSQKADIKMVYLNSDGSKGEMCGNGSRCFARFAFEKGLVNKPAFDIETDAGIIHAGIVTDEKGMIGSIGIALGRPVLDGKSVPTDLPGNPVLMEPLKLGKQELLVNAIRLTLPHCVIVTEDLEGLDLEGLGAGLEWHPVFPEGINVNFMQIINRGCIRIKTWERGARHTLACGTGSSASVVVGNVLGLLDSNVEVITEGGALWVSLSPEYDVTMEGPAEFICDGECSSWLLAQAGFE